MSLPAACDGAAYDRAHSLAQRRSDAERAFFAGEQRFAWSDPVNPQRFEDMIGELLASLQPVVRIRGVGTVNQPDRERDHVADWILPTGNVPEGVSPARTGRVIVQCKARKRSLSVDELPRDLGGILVEHAADGFFLAVSSQLTPNAFDRLDALRQKTSAFVDWWERTQIEDALRRAPSVAARFTDVVRPLTPQQTSPDS